MFCSSCGQEIPEHAAFCNHCGAAQPAAAGRPPKRDPSYAQGRPQGDPAYVRSQQPGTPAHAQSRQQVNPASEKAFLQYIMPRSMRNTCVILGVLAIPLVFAVPFLGIGCAVFALLFGLIWYLSSRQVKKRVARAQANGTYEAMLWEFASSTPMLGDRVRRSENFLFSRHSGLFYAYPDIVWIYRHLLRYYFVPVHSQIMVGDRDGRILAFCKLKPSKKKGDTEIQALAALVYSKNPAVLLGFDGERQAEFKRRTKK